MPVRRPFDKLNLRNHLRLHPYTVFHLFSGQCPRRAFFRRQIREGAGIDLQALKPLVNFLPVRGTSPFFTLPAYMSLSRS
jgi:hypothetical protein